MSAEAAAALGHELSCLTALAESIPWVDKLRHSTKWDAITISGLRQVPHGSEEWEMGRESVQAGLEAVSGGSHHFTTELVSISREPESRTSNPIELLD
jgi:hypothetical protein